MRHRNVGHVVVLGALLLSCGCYPAVVTGMPRITGRVIDERGSAIRGADIAIARGTVVTDKLKSQEDGRFQRPAETKWIVVPLVFINMTGPSFNCTASYGGNSVARGYSGTQMQMRFLGLGKVHSVDLGDLVIPKTAGR